MSRGKRALFGLILAGITLLFLEIVSWVGLSLVHGGLVGWGSLQEARDRILEAGFGAADTEGGEAESAELELTEAAEEAEEIAEEAVAEESPDGWRPLPNALHPFLGFVRNPTHPTIADAPHFHRESGEYGFPETFHAVLQKPNPSRLVVGIFGGSVANIFGTAGRPALERQLGKIPRFAGREIVVVAVSMGGYKQPQQLMALNYLLSLGGHFDVVINLDGFNEVALPQSDLIPRGVFPHFPRNWPLMAGRLNPELRQAIGRLDYLRGERLQLAERFSGAPWRYSFTANLVWSLLDGGREGRVAAAEEALLDVQSSEERPYHVRGPRHVYPKPADSYGELARVWRQSSLQMARLCEGLGIEYYHFLQPNQYVPQSKPLSDEERRKFWQRNHRYRPGVLYGYPLLQREGAKLVAAGVAFHDVTQVFSQIEDTLYFDSCCHFGRRGNRLLAAEVARRIADGPPSR